MLQQPARSISVGDSVKEIECRAPSLRPLTIQLRRRLFWERDLREHVTWLSLAQHIY